MLEGMLVGLLVVLVVLMGAILVLLQTRRASGYEHTALLAEKLARLDPVSQAVANIQLSLAEVHAHVRARHDVEVQMAQSVRRLEAVIAGTNSRGAAGENLVEVIFSQLPVDWQVRNFTVGNRTVEFGLRLPNNLVVPIDSKWTAAHLIEQLSECDDPAARQRIKRQIEQAVLEKAQEVTKYLDPNVTAGFGVAVIPDAVYELATGAQVEAFRMNVVLVSYGMFMPYLLLVFQTMLQASHSIDSQKLDAYLTTAQTSMAALQEELEGRFSRAITMLSNSRADMSLHLSKINTGLASLRLQIEDRRSEIED